ncbi:MAG: hypothetical protein LBJ64_01265 [Deltaproteobacteria bacterium]|jgi:hypothetical protein|nr:hypothetical protein [Deltaproteobacteria bacterium]
MDPIDRKPDNHGKRLDYDVKHKDSYNDAVKANEPHAGDREPDFTPNFNDENVINKNSSDCKNQPTDLSPAERAAIIGRVVNERMPQAYAAKLLGRNIRTVQRMTDTYRAEGDEIIFTWRQRR